MTHDYTIHTTSGQPRSTKGKIVKFRLFESERFGQHWADLLNWATEGDRVPTSGRIAEYKIIN